MQPNRKLSDSELYWQERKDMVYYQVVRMLVSQLAGGGASLLDVGSGNCPYLGWFPRVPERISLDLRKPYEAPGITSVRTDFLAWQPGRKFDVTSCLQVLEHVPDAGAFAQKLLEVSRTLIVSVPYKWPHGQTRTHIHDPVDEAKMLAWFGREPNYSYLCREVKANVFRLIHVYEEFPETWTALNKRAKLVKQKALAADATGSS
jgi:hypothetical protein